MLTLLPRMPRTSSEVRLKAAVFLKDINFVFRDKSQKRFSDLFYGRVLTLSYAQIMHTISYHDETLPIPETQREYYVELNILVCVNTSCRVSRILLGENRGVQYLPYIPHDPQRP